MAHGDVTEPQEEKNTNGSIVALKGGTTKLNNFDTQKNYSANSGDHRDITNLNETSNPDLVNDTGSVSDIENDGGINDPQRQGGIIVSERRTARNATYEAVKIITLVMEIIIVILFCIKLYKRFYNYLTDQIKVQLAQQMMQRNSPVPVAHTTRHKTD
jgi:hypothetical protein